ncbi:hypothetical protein [Algirhabdus cladophorae]|uniref:hypothetical protein n=1 Tax=Algirhabdus cladophorae TaxID=3377108 RepID=UPI003B84B385
MKTLFTLGLLVWMFGVMGTSSAQAAGCAKIQSVLGDGTAIYVRIANTCKKTILVNWGPGGSRVAGVDKAVLSAGRSQDFQMAGPPKMRWCYVKDGVANPQVCSGKQMALLRTGHDFTSKDHCLTEIETEIGEWIYFTGVRNKCAYLLNIVVTAYPEAGTRKGSQTSEGQAHLSLSRTWTRTSQIRSGGSYQFPKKFWQDGKRQGEDILYAACVGTSNRQTFPAIVNGSGRSVCSALSTH